MTRSLLIALVLTTLAPAAPPLAAAEEIEPVVVFRDGTLISVSLADGALPWRRIAEDGRVLEEPVKISEVERLSLVRTPATEQVALVRRLAAQLGDVNYHKREEAQAALLKMGGKFRNVLVEYGGRTSDMEEKWRLGVLLKSLPPGQGLMEADYDLLRLPGDSAPRSGDASAWAPRVRFRGGELTLERSAVAAFGKIPRLPPPAFAPAAPRTERIEADQDEYFPADVVRIDFERGPRGEELADDRDIASVFAPLGCIFSNSIENSYISAQSYNVGGRSGGKCAATYSPRYQGTMTIRFCQPDFEHVPASVTLVGLSVSHVSPRGTGLVAFDAWDRQLGEVWATRTGTDYLALKCNSPIAYVHVMPNPEVDKDFAIDDLVFDPPRALAEAPAGENYAVLLTSGERLLCAALETSADSAALKQLSLGIDELKAPLEELAAVSFPRRGPPRSESSADCLVRLADGSLLRAATDGGLKYRRFPKLPVDPGQIVALWGLEVVPELPADEAWVEDSALLLERGKPAQALGKWKLGAAWIELAEGAEPPAHKYAESPPVWLRKPPPLPEGCGMLRLVSGEELVLAASAFKLVRWSASAIVVARGGEEISIPTTDALSLVPPPEDKRGE